MSTDEDTNPYELLGLELGATDSEIRTAYRQRSLKVHPDRNRGNPDAARKFHELNQGYELLLDPLRRLALDAKIKIKQEKKLRYAHYDNKRKAMMEELEVRESEFKKARMGKQREETARNEENERIKEEGRRLREMRDEEARKREEDQRRERAAEAVGVQDDDDPPTQGPLDTTVKLKYSLKAHPNLTTPESLSNLLLRFGPTDTSSIVLSLKPPKKNPSKPAKFATALVSFRQIGDAFGAVGASKLAGSDFSEIEVGWAEGSEPQILAWLKKMGKLGSTDNEKPGGQKASTEEVSGFSSFPEDAGSPVGGMDYESLTLLRLRQAERERLARAIREQEAEEERLTGETC